MAKSTNTKTRSGATDSSSSMKNAIFIIPLIAIIAIIWLLLMNMEMLPESLTFGWDMDNWYHFWMVVLIILIVVLFCIPQSGESSREAEAVEVDKLEGGKKVKKRPKRDKDTMVTIETDEKPLEFVPVSSETLKSLKEKPAEPSEPEQTDESEIKTTEPEIKSDIKSAEVVAKPVQSRKIKPKIVEYPLDVEGGVYGDTFIDLNDERVLKLRTLVVKDIYLL